ncbi:MAG TPA: diguanylate cyclase [Solirubrobacteraceae bacterium]|nr:diguanylate cyclase [Solirubrobacteraceae bacterium]
MAELGDPEAAGAIADRKRRLAAVADLQLLDRIGDPVLTKLTRMARFITGASSAAVHVFDEHYQRRIAAVGAPLVDHPEPDSMCRVVVHQGTRVITPDATLDGRFDYSSFVTDPQAPVRFYAAVPLRVGSGVAIGTLCAFDTAARELTDEQVARLEDLADLARAHLELVKIAANLGEAATIDGLTGAVNRVIFDDRLAQALARRRRHGTELLVAMIDVDRFKAINDTHGHARGDAALQWLARQLRECIRAEDTVGRLGGDEFGLMAEVTSGQFESLLKVMRCAPDGFEPAFTVSVGAAVAQDGDSVETILERADAAMYAVKRQHRARERAA